MQLCDTNMETEIQQKTFMEIKDECYTQIQTIYDPEIPVVEQKIKAIEGVKSCRVEITFEPTWDQEMMSEAAKLELGFL